jgi:hypothetical protein
VTLIDGAAQTSGGAWICLLVRSDVFHTLVGCNACELVVCTCVSLAAMLETSVWQSHGASRVGSAVTGGHEVGMGCKCVSTVDFG